MASRDPDSTKQEERNLMTTIGDIYKTLGRIIHTNHSKLTVDHVNDSNKARGILGSVMRELERRQRLDLVYILLNLYEQLDHQLIKLQEWQSTWTLEYKPKLETITAITKET